jgi:hypothetical protein
MELLREMVKACFEKAFICFLFASTHIFRKNILEDALSAVKQPHSYLQVQNSRIYLFFYLQIFYYAQLN